jgi:hypothetical protein
MRRLLKDKRGQVRVIEAFLASMLILACLSFVPPQSTGVSRSSLNIDSTAQNVLLSLDSNGQFGRYIDSHDWASLDSCLQSALPLTVWYNLTVYDSSGTCLNNYPICNGGAVSNKVSSVTYICTSPNSNYAVYVLQLQLAVMD